MTLQKATFCLLVNFLFSPGKVSAQLPSSQITEISGKVIDASTKEPMPYAGVTLLGPSRKIIFNTSTNPKGDYFIRTAEKADSISFSYMGCITQTLVVQKGRIQELNIALTIIHGLPVITITKER